MKKHEAWIAVKLSAKESMEFTQWLIGVRPDNCMFDTHPIKWLIIKVWKKLHDHVHFNG